LYYCIVYSAIQPLKAASVLNKICFNFSSRGSGERYSSPSGSGWSPAAKLIFVQFTVKKYANLLKVSPRAQDAHKLGVFQ